MRIKLDSKGVTLIELIIVIALSSIIMTAAFAFLGNTNRIMWTLGSQSSRIDEARIAVMKMERDIRSSRATSVGSNSYVGVNMYDSGLRMDVYADTDNSGTIKLVQYKVVGNSLVRGEANLGSTPTRWTTLIKNIENGQRSPVVPLCLIDGKSIKTNLIITDTKNRDDMISVNTSITVRSKGGMSN